MRNALLAVLAVAVPIAAFASPPRLPGNVWEEHARPSYQQAEVRQHDLRQNDQYKSEASIRHEKIPEAVKNMLKYDICTSAVANCN